MSTLYGATFLGSWKSVWGTNNGEAFFFFKAVPHSDLDCAFINAVRVISRAFSPLILAKVIDDGIVAEDMGVVLWWGSIMIGMSLLAFTSGIINSFYAAHTSQSTGYDIRAQLYQKVQDFSLANLQKFQTSSLITRLTNDVTQIQNTIFMGLRIMLRAPLLVIGGTIMALIVNARLALFLVVTIPVLIFFLIWMMRKGSVAFKQVQLKLDRVNHVIRENLAGMKLVKAFVRRRHEAKRFSKENEELKDKTVYALRLMEVTMPILLLLMNASIIGVLWFGNVQVQAGGVQVGEIVAIINYVTRITGALTVFAMIVMVFSRSRASAERISEVLDTEVDLRDGQGALPQLSDVTGSSISFQNVSFSYPEIKEPALRELSFNVQGGQTIAILGGTGSGKTSLFQLIPRLYDVGEGAIRIDGTDIRAMKIKEVRQMIGYVPQEALLFSGSIKDNIAWGSETASFEDIVQAAKDAQIHQMIERLPNQYETKIGQKGVNLSGGQKQRLSIARALVRKPRILLLDDSTSALDVETEASLLTALRKYSCTILLITQKLGTAKSADEIFLLNDGEIIKKREP